ncbi:hypothetical protein BDC45DRAFT_56331 [Circinella umbellata]|nr:hypothetical protein BDC45DRAFT_56331 [Circinella umbellata]
MNLYLELSWCGLNINTSTLDISSDFSRYRKNNMRDLMTLKFVSYYKDIQRQITQTIKTKQTRLLVDVDFNARDTIYRNLFEAYLLSALKFRIYVRQLFMYNKKVSWKIIFKTLLQAQKETSSRLSPYLNHSSIRILFLYAFCKILNRKL